MADPSPCAPPVTSATRPERLNVSLMVMFPRMSYPLEESLNRSPGVRSLLCARAYTFSPRRGKQNTKKPGKVRPNMRVFLTGGSGDLGQVLSAQLEKRGDAPVLFDVRPPRGSRWLYVKGSILDRQTLQQGLAGMDCVVHIAAWHGIHEATGAKDVY